MARTDRNNLRTARNLRRSSFTRAVKQSFLIVCEGENTEPDYFNAFRLTSANVRAIGKGDNTLHLINEALIIRENERRRGHYYDQCWVVFDKDDFPNDDFTKAIHLAEANGMKVAYSNQAFELWFLLHYNLIQGPMHRNQYAAKLSRLLGFEYSKEDGIAAKIYHELVMRQEQAIKNAKTIMRQMSDIPPALAESSTTVYRLVEELNKYRD